MWISKSQGIKRTMDMTVQKASKSFEHHHGEELIKGYFSQSGTDRPERLVIDKLCQKVPGCHRIDQIKSTQSSARKTTNRIRNLIKGKSVCTSSN